MKFISFLLFYLFSVLLAAQNFYDIEHIPEIKLEFESQHWKKKLDILKKNGKKERAEATLWVDGIKYEKVGVRYKGNSSFKSTKKSGSQKLPFNIKVNYVSKDQKLPGKFETIKLSNGFRDPSFIREVLSYEVARKYMPAPRANFAKLYINGSFFGLYNNVESVDEHFLKKNFDENKGVFVKCDPDWKAIKPSTCAPGDKSSLMYQGKEIKCYLPNYELKSDEGWETLIALTDVLNNKPEKLSEYLNIDRCLWMHAFNNILINLDSYTGRLCHNYYLYKDNSGLFNPIVWDMNLSIGGFRYDGTGKILTNEDLQTLSPFIHYKQKNEKRPLIVDLLNVELYRKVYIAHLKTILEEYFFNGHFFNRLDELRNFIEPEVKADNNKLYSFENFKQNIQETVELGNVKIVGITELMQPRVEYLRDHPLIRAESPKIEFVEHLKFANTIAVRATIPACKNVWLVYQAASNVPFQYVQMYDDSSSNDVLAKDSIWGATIDYKSGIKYYIIAENDKCASLSPSRAGYEFYTIE